MIEIAIHDAALRNASDVYSYAVTLLRDWYYQEVTTPDEYVEYSFMRDSVNGRLTGVSSTSDLETMHQQYEERKKKHEAARRGGGNGCDSEEDI